MRSGTGCLAILSISISTAASPISSSGWYTEVIGGLDRALASVELKLIIEIFSGTRSPTVGSRSHRHCARHSSQQMTAVAFGRAERTKSRADGIQSSDGGQVSDQVKVCR